MMAKNNLVSLEIVNFKQEIERIEREVKELANEEIEELIHYGTEQLKIVTPVDKGRARMGWFDEIERNRYGGFTGGNIINEVPYIGRLNAGWSKQAPSYFIEQTLVKIGIITPS
jgi:hypothetical protein